MWVKDMSYILIWFIYKPRKCVQVCFIYIYVIHLKISYNILLEKMEKCAMNDNTIGQTCK